MQAISTQLTRSRGLNRAAALGIVGALALAGCSSENTDSTEVEIDGAAQGATGASTQTQTLEVAGDSAFPSETISDVITYADQVSEFIVVSERDGKPEGGQEPYIPRYVTIRIVANLWEGPRINGRSDLLGSTVDSEVEILTWGSVTGGDINEPRAITAQGEPRLEVGESYVGALFVTNSDPENFERTLYPRTVALVGSNGKVSGGQANILVSGSLDTAMDDIRALLASAKLDPVAEALAMSDSQFVDLDPIYRIDRIDSARNGSEIEVAPVTTAPSPGD